MSKNTPKSSLPDVKQMRVGIVRAEWNGEITSRLVESALRVLKAHGVADDDINVFDVPGAVELTFGASQLIESGLFDVVIVFGCVVRGGTPHFEYVCQSVTQGIAFLNSDCDIPVIFGVLTVNDEQDAIDRVGGKCGDKGAEAAEAAIKMHHFNATLREM